MATELQKRAVEALVESGRSVSGAMRKAGYSSRTAVDPGKLTRSKGFKELLKQYGLTEGLITKALVEDIKAKKGKRVEELKLGSDILGMRKEEKDKLQGNTTLIQINIHSPNENAGNTPNAQTVPSVASPSES